MSSIDVFTPSWLEFSNSSLKTYKSIIDKNIYLEISEKPNLFKKINKLNIDELVLKPETNFRFNFVSKKSFTDTSLNNIECNRHLDYLRLDERKYFFTSEDYYNFLKNPHFDTELCRIKYNKNIKTPI